MDSARGNHPDPTLASVAALTLFAVVFAAFWEIGAALCASAAVFAGYGLFWMLALLPALLKRPSRLKWGFYVALLLFLLVLYLVPWNSRKPFLRDLDRVKVGMTVEEVEAIMGKYIKGTGWPVAPGETSTSGQLTEVSSGLTLATTASDSGELEIRDSITYRHADRGNFDSDWGVVTFRDGRVVAKNFLPD